MRGRNCSQVFVVLGEMRILFIGCAVGNKGKAGRVRLYEWGKERWRELDWTKLES